MFVELTQAMMAGEKLSFTIERMQDGSLRSVLEPRLQDDDGHLSEQLQSIRANLSMPVIWKASPEELDAHFNEMLTTVGQTRQRITNDFREAKARLQEAENAAKKTAAEVKEKKGDSANASSSNSAGEVDKKADQNDADTVPPPQQNTKANPDSL